MGISNTNRFGLGLVALLCAVSLLILAYREYLPQQESISNHSFVPNAFGEIQSSHRAQNEPTNLGFAYSVPSIAFPQDNKIINSWVTEPGATAPLGVRFLRIHKSIQLDKSTIEALGTAVNNPVRAWFYQGQIVAVQKESQFLLNISAANRGFEQQRNRYIIYASFAIFLGLFFYFWPRLLAFCRSLLIRKNFS